MSKFLGKWKGDGSSFVNFEAFAKASGLPDEVYEKLKQGTYSLEFSRNGDTWSYDVVSSILPTKTYTFQPGKEVNTTDLFGKSSKFTAVFDSDSKMTLQEQAEMMDWKNITVTREIKDDVMLVEVELENGVKMSQEFTRC